MMNRVAVALLLSLLSLSAYGQAAYVDSAIYAEASNQVTTAETASLTTTGSDKFVLAFVSSSASAAANVSQCKFGSTAGTGGQAMTIVGSHVDHHANGRVSLWRLIGPSTTSGTVWCEWAAVQDERIITAMSLSGVDQTTPLGTLATDTGVVVSDGQPALSGISAVIGDMVVDFVVVTDTGAGTTSVAPDSGQTEREDHGTSPAYDWHAAGTLVAVGTSETRNWAGLTPGTSAGWAVFGVAVKAAAGGGGGGGLPALMFHRRQMFKH